MLIHAHKLIIHWLMPIKCSLRRLLNKFWCVIVYRPLLLSSPVQEIRVDFASVLQKTFTYFFFHGGSTV